MKSSSRGSSRGSLLATGLLAYGMASSMIAGVPYGITFSGGYNSDFWQSMGDKRSLVVGDYHSNSSTMVDTVATSSNSTSFGSKDDGEPVITPFERRRRRALVVRSRKYAPTYNIDDIPREVF